MGGHCFLCKALRVGLGGYVFGAVLCRILSVLWVGNLPHCIRVLLRSVSVSCLVISFLPGLKLDYYNRFCWVEFGY